MAKAYAERDLDGHAATASLWAELGGDPAALSQLELTGAEPVLPSSFKVGVAAQASIAASGLAAAELWRLRGGQRQQVSVGMQHAAFEFNSEKYLVVDGNRPPRPWNELSGLYATGDGRRIRLHTNFTHHRDAVVRLLNCGPTRAEVEAALLTWGGEDFETQAHAAGGCVAMVRTPAEWAAHPQGKAVAAMPAITIERIGEAPPLPLGFGPRPMSGMRVIELTRVIAGPVGGRTLAAHGATVMRVNAPGGPSFEWADWLDKDTGRGKLAAAADLATPEGQDTLSRLLSEADILVQGYRPGAIARHGFSPMDAARIRPGIIYVSLSAYAHEGPWAERRGFDSLVQTLDGIDHEEGLAAGATEARPLPCQALDHAAGYYIAAAAMMAKARQSQEGGSWHIRVSLDRAGHWIAGLGRVPCGLELDPPKGADIRPYLEKSASPFGEIFAMSHAARLVETPCRWDLPPVPVGSSPAVWPPR